MITWLALIGPLIVWSCHFTGVYVATEFSPAALGIVVPVLTLLGLFANLVFFFRWRHAQAWHVTIARGGAVLSSVAIAWQALPIYL